MSKDQIQPNDKHTQYMSDVDNDMLYFRKRSQTVKGESPKANFAERLAEIRARSAKKGDIEQASDLNGRLSRKIYCPVCGSTDVSETATLQRCNSCNSTIDSARIPKWQGGDFRKMVTSRSIGRVENGVTQYGYMAKKPGSKNPGVFQPVIFLPKSKAKRLNASRLLTYEDNKRQINSLAPTIFHLNGKRLSDEIEGANITIRDADILMIKAPKGCGKSVAIKSILKAKKRLEAAQIGKVVTDEWNPSVCAIVHRRSLAVGQSTDWDLENYMDDGESTPGHRYVTSIDSLWKLDGKSLRYEILVLDECEQIFRHLLSDTIEKKQEQIFKVLVKLICEADQIICSDADLTMELTGYLLSVMRRQFEKDRLVLIINKWNADRDINVYDDKYHLVADLMCAVNEGKRVYVPVSELRLANQLAKLMELSRTPDGEPVKVLMLTGETSEGEEAKAFFADPNSEVKKYSVLIATSTLSTGVSIDAKWFDEVVGIFDGRVYTYQDCDQAISRVRTCPTVKVWVHPGIKGQYTSQAQIRSGPVKKERLTRSLVGQNSKGELSPEEERFMDVYACIQWCEQQWKEDRTEKFKALKVSEGWNVYSVEKFKNSSMAGRSLLSIGSDPTGSKPYIDIFQAKNLNLEEFDELKGKKNLRGKEKHSVMKGYISKTFDLSSPSLLTMKQIEAYFEKGVRDVITNAKLLKASRIEAMEIDKRQREFPKNTKAFTSFDHKTMTRDILQKAQTVCGINQAELLAKAQLHSENEDTFSEFRKLHHPNSRQYRAASQKRSEIRNELKCTVTRLQIDRLASYVEENLELVNLYFGTNFKTPTAQESKLKVFNAIFSRLGVAIKKSRNSNDNSADYFVDYDRVKELVATKDLNDLI